MKKTLDLEERIKQLRAINEISKEIGESLDLNKTLNSVVLEVSDLLKCARTTIMLIDSEKKYLTIEAAKGFPESEIAKVRIKLSESISGYVADTGNPIFIPNIEEDSRFKKKNEGQYITGSLISVPLKIRKETIGVINVSNKYNHQPFTADDRDILITISYIVASSIDKARKYEETRLAAITDGLTGLYNQRHFYTTLSVEMERARRYNTDLSLAIIDIDGFKKVNDTYGHQQGDIVLNNIADVLAESIRTPDFIARYGGEEFVIIFPQTNIKVAKQVAERIRVKIEKYRFFSDSLKNLRLTISLGLAGYKKGMLEKTIVEYADKALYAAKQKGKNTYCAHKDGS